MQPRRRRHRDECGRTKRSGVRDSRKPRRGRQYITSFEVVDRALHSRCGGEAADVGSSSDEEEAVSHLQLMQGFFPGIAAQFEDHRPVGYRWEPLAGAHVHAPAPPPRPPNGSCLT